MRTTCLVNNFNYRRFVGEAVDSALAQTRAFDQVVVVDDGSTDESLYYLRRRYAADHRVEIVAKANGGQLSAFNEGLEQATGELVFFLDADDRYRPDYLRQTLEVYARRDVDFVIAGVESFGPATTQPRRRHAERNLGYSTLAALLARKYVGGPTSALSMRRSIAERVLPCPFESDWRTRADDVLVLGASIVGARKYQMHAPLVEYRVHGGNHFSGRKASAERKYAHGLAVNRLVQWYAQQVGYDLVDLPRLLHREFATIERPTLAEWRLYQKMSWRAKLPWLVRGRHFGETTVHYWRERLAHRPAGNSSTAFDDAQPTIALPPPGEATRRAA